MITRYYEIVCDACGWAQHLRGNIQTAEKRFRDYGGIVTRNKKHYCEKDCKAKGRLEQE